MTARIAAHVVIPPDDILIVLEEGPKASVQLAEVFGCPRIAVVRVLQGLQRAGQVKRTRTMKDWALVSFQPKPGAHKRPQVDHEACRAALLEQLQAGPLPTQDLFRRLQAASYGRRAFEAALATLRTESLVQKLSDGRYTQYALASHVPMATTSVPRATSSAP